MRACWRQQTVHGEEDAGAGDPARLAMVDLCHMLLCTNEFLYIE